MRITTHQYNILGNLSDSFHKNVYNSIPPLQGYLFISVMMHHNHDLYKLVIQAIKNDLNSKQPVHVCLALTCIANIGTPEMAGEIGDEVPRILTAP